MKVCPLCKNSYEEWVEFCFQDGVPLVAQTQAAPPPPPPSSLASAPALPPEVMDQPGGNPFDAFDAPEPTLIRMARLSTAAPVAAAPTPARPPAAQGGDVPDARSAMSAAELPTVPDAAAVPEVPAAAPAAPHASPVVRRAGRDAGTPAAEPTAEAAVPEATPAAVEPAHAEPPVALAAPAAAAEAPASAEAEFDFPSTDEDAKATLVLPTPQPAPPRERERERVAAAPSGSAAPTAAGIGLAMMGAIGAAVIALGGVGYLWWSSRQAPEAPAKPPVEPPAAVNVPAPPPVEPPAPPPAEVPVELPPEDQVPGELPPAGTPPAGTPPAGTTPGATPTPVKPPPGTPPAGTATKPPPGGTTPGSGDPASPWGAAAVTPPAGTSPVSSDNPWGTTEAVSSGRLTITTDPAGAQVTVNDQARGPSPVTVEVPYGKHRVRVSLAGYRSESSDVNINVQSMSVPFRLTAEEQKGFINVFGPTGASVWLDGRDLGPLPVSVEVREGTHTLKLIQADGQSCTTSRDLRFAPGGRPVAVNLPACG